MKEENNSRGLLRCSFCGRTQTEVDRMITGPGVCICDQCIEACMGILQGDMVEEFTPDKFNENISDKTLPKPEEIKKKLDEYVIGQEL